MNRVPAEGLVLISGNSLITATIKEGRALAITISRHMIHNLQPDLDILKAGRPNYAANPDSLIAVSQIVAIEFQTLRRRIITGGWHDSVVAYFRAVVTALAATFSTGPLPSQPFAEYTSLGAM